MSDICMRIGVRQVEDRHVVTVEISSRPGSVLLSTPAKAREQADTMQAVAKLPGVHGVVAALRVAADIAEARDRGLH